MLLDLVTVESVKAIDVLTEHKQDDVPAGRKPLYLIELDFGSSVVDDQLYEVGDVVQFAPAGTVIMRKMTLDYSGEVVRYRYRVHAKKCSNGITSQGLIFPCAENVEVVDLTPPESCPSYCEIFDIPTLRSYECSPDELALWGLIDIYEYMDGTMATLEFNMSGECIGCYTKNKTYNPNHEMFCHLLPRPEVQHALALALSTPLKSLDGGADPKRRFALTGWLVDSSDQCSRFHVWQINVLPSPSPLGHRLSYEEMLRIVKVAGFSPVKRLAHDISPVQHPLKSIECQTDLVKDGDLIKGFILEGSNGRLISKVLSSVFARVRQAKIYMAHRPKLELDV